MQNQLNAPATDLLRSQHRQVEVMFDQIIDAEGDARSELFDCLRATLAVHETAEELVVHPTARGLGEEGERIVEARLSEEGKAKEALAELEKLTADGEGFGPKLLALKQDVLAHAAAEERELFPLLEGSCDRDEQERMAELIRTAEKLAPTHPHPHLPDTALPQLLVGPFVGMIDKVRDKLFGDREPKVTARSTESLAEQAAACRACHLWERATQVVFGEGSADASLMLVGEQPGHEEDLAGAPFVGPAGRLLDDAIDAAGLDRSTLYVTNAVKHFKWEPRGKRRIHQKPTRTEVVACHRWIESELEVVDPAVVVVLGATAGQALLGPSYRVGAAKDAVLEVDGRPLVGTVHPSAVLRARDEESRRGLFDGLVADLVRADSLAS